MTLKQAIKSNIGGILFFIAWLMLFGNSMTKPLNQPMFLKDIETIKVSVGVKHSGVRMFVGDTTYRHYCYDDFMDSDNSPCNKVLSEKSLIGKNVNFMLIRKRWEFDKIVILNGEFYDPTSSTTYPIRTSNAEIERLSQEHYLLHIVTLGFLLAIVFFVWRDIRLDDGEE